MSWNSLWKPAASVAALLFATLPATAIADPLVVRSSGPSAKSYPPGKALAPTARIALAAGDTVVILDGRGTRTLKGPGSFSPTVTESSSVDNRTTFAALVNQRTERRARIGAVRGVNTASNPAAGRSPNLWFVDTERSSTVCVVDPARVTLWRGDMSQPASFTITGSDGKSETVAWLKGQSAKPWPTTLPIDGGSTYRVNWKGVSQPVELKFALLGPDAEGLQDMAAALIQNGCDAQLDLLIETVAVPGESRPAG